jgi:putative membrane protein
LQYAVLAMLIVAGLSGLYPALLEHMVALSRGGWAGEATPAAMLAALLILQTVVFLAVRYGLAWMPLRIALTPKATRERRVRRRAVQYFRVAAERRTAARVGVLLYLSLDEHVAEIVADESIHGKVAPEAWGDAMAALIEQVRAGKPGEGMAAAVAGIGMILSTHFPKTGADVNELPDRLIEL